MNRFRIGLATSLLALASLADAAPAALVLRDRVAVDGASIRLADLVVDGERLARSEPRAAGLALWSSPLPCKIARVSRDELATRLRELHFAAGSLSGSEAVVVERACHPVDAAALRETARSTLAGWLQPQVQRFELVAVESVPTLALAEADAKLVARPIEHARPLATRMTVWIDVVSGDRVVRSLPVGFDVHAFGDAWVAVRDLHADRVVSSGDLMQRELDLAGSGLGAAGALATVPDAARLRKPLLAGQVLTAAHLQSDAPLRNGSRIVARSLVGAVAVEASALALQDGRLGDRVWIRIAGATAPVQARVVDTSLVEVERD